MLIRVDGDDLMRLGGEGEYLIISFLGALNQETFSRGRTTHEENERTYVMSCLENNNKKAIPSDTVPGVCLELFGDGARGLHIVAGDVVHNWPRFTV